MRGHETPENHPLTILKGFSTVSVEICVESTLGHFIDFRKEPATALLPMEKRKE
jgi:hypothetical protein